MNTPRPCDPDFDPLAAESFDSPYQLYAQLRARCPVAHSTAWGGFWAVLRHAAVHGVLANPATFITRSKTSGITLINLIGNLGSLAGPYVIGVLRANTESFTAPVWFVAAVLGVGAMCLATLHRRRFEA